jgi:hypothetical protein
MHLFDEYSNEQGNDKVLVRELLVCITIRCHSKGVIGEILVGTHAT